MDIMHKFSSSRFLTIHESSLDAGTLTETTYWFKITYRIHWILLEQLERLCSEDMPRRLMTNQTIESYLIPSQKKTNSWILKQALHVTHLLKILDRMSKYEMDPTSIVEDTEWTRFCPRIDRRTDRQMDRKTNKLKPVYPPFNFVAAGVIMNVEYTENCKWPPSHHQSVHSATIHDISCGLSQVTITQIS